MHVCLCATYMPCAHRGQKKTVSREVSGDFLLREELSPSCLAGWLEMEEKEGAGNSEVVDLSNCSPGFAPPMEPLFVPCP